MFLRALLLLGLCLFALWPQWGLGEYYGTEGRRVQITLEMLRSGDFWVPTLGGLPTWAKPPLHYWLSAGLLAVGGGEPWVARLPGVLAAFAAAFVAGELLRRWFGPAAGWVGALGIACSPVVLVMFPTAEIDPLFASLTAISLWFLATGVARERTALVVLSGLFGGLAMLQKGPPYLLFAVGAYLVWWRRRGLRFAVAHFLPLLLVPLAYYVPLWLLRVAPDAMFAVIGEETVGRVATFQWKHVVAVPDFWLRAVAVQLPFVLWCFWEWRGPRDARMDAADLTLRMCSGGAVLAVVVLTFFPGRPTRYLLPNVLLFTFAVAPAVAHFAAQPRQLGALSRRVLQVLGVAGAGLLLAAPWLDGRLALAAAALGLALAGLPRWVTTPRRLVAACLLLPVVGAYTVQWERAASWPTSPRSRAAAAAVLRRELDARGILAADLGSHGHVEAPLLLGAGLLPHGDEFSRRAPTAPWVLHEAANTPPPHLEGYVERLRIVAPGEVFVVRQRVEASPK